MDQPLLPDAAKNRQCRRLLKLRTADLQASTFIVNVLELNAKKKIKFFPNLFFYTLNKDAYQSAT